MVLREGGEEGVLFPHKSHFLELILCTFFFFFGESLTLSVNGIQVPEFLGYKI